MVHEFLGYARERERSFFSANALVICTVDVQSFMLVRNLSSFFTETDIRDFVGLYCQLCPGE